MTATPDPPPETFPHDARTGAAAAPSTTPDREPVPEPAAADATPPLSPTFRFFIQFWRTGRTLGDTLSARLERDHGLDLRDYLVLNSIHNGRRYPTELAERLQIGKDMVSRIVNKLLRAGLIERTIDEADSRRTRLHVSAAGLAQRDAVKATIERTIAPVLDALGADRRDGMTDTLESFNRLLQEHLAGAGQPRAAGFDTDARDPNRPPPAGTEGREGPVR